MGQPDKTFGNDLAVRAYSAFDENNKLLKRFEWPSSNLIAGSFRNKVISLSWRWCYFATLNFCEFRRRNCLIFLLIYNYAVECRFLEPPRETNIILRNRELLVRNVGGKFTGKQMAEKNNLWFELSGILKNEGFEKSWFQCI